MSARIAVYSDQPKVLEQLKEAAGTFNFILNENPPVEDALKDGFIVCDLESFRKKEKKLRDVKKHLLYILSEDTDDNNMLLIEKHQLHHLVGLNENTYPQEIMENIKKTFDGKIWGLNRYLEASADVKVLSLSDSRRTNEMMTETLSQFDFQEYFSSPSEYLQVMANELISNSLYKGPNRRRSEQGLVQQDRKSPAFLKGSELVQVSLGMDSKGIGLSVQDSFGGLNYETIIGNLKRSFEEKKVMDKVDGAGLGLYLTFLHSNQFIVNYRKNFRTEVICIIEKNKRYKNYKQRIRSFHFFHEVPCEKIND